MIFKVLVLVGYLFIGTASANLPKEDNSLPRLMDSMLAPADFVKSISGDKVREQRHKLCIDRLEKYFHDEVPADGLKFFLIAQNELTTYKIFGSLIAQRLANTKDIKRGKRTKKEIVKYRDFINEHLELMKESAKSDPEFKAAMKSFDQAPLSVSALAKVAPFLNKSLLLNTSIYDDPMAANFRLNENDFKMLDILASVEEQRGEVNSDNFLHQIQKTDDKTISDIDATINLPIMNKRRISFRKKQVENFLRTLTVPKECKQERKDIALGLNCYSCLDKTDQSLYSLTQMSNEISQLLFNTILQRKDLKTFRESRDGDIMYYVGRKSAWGSIEDGTYRP